MNTNWRGNEISRGEFISTPKKLAQELNLTEKQIRTSIGKLKKTGEMASKGTTQHTVFKVINYDEYQPEGERKGEQEGEQKGKQRATANKYNNKNNNISKPPSKKRLDKDLVLPQEWFDSAIKYWTNKNRFDLNALEEFDSFKAHHLANGTTSTDFKYNWKTWYTNAIKYKRGSHAANPQPAPATPAQPANGPASAGDAFATQDTYDEIERLRSQQHFFQ